LRSGCLSADRQGCLYAPEQGSERVGAPSLIPRRIQRSVTLSWRVRTTERRGHAEQGAQRGNHSRPKCGDLQPAKGLTRRAFLASFACDSDTRLCRQALYGRLVRRGKFRPPHGCRDPGRSVPRRGAAPHPAWRRVHRRLEVLSCEQDPHCSKMGDATATKLTSDDAGYRPACPGRSTWRYRARRKVQLVPGGSGMTLIRPKLASTWCATRPSAPLRSASRLACTCCQSQPAGSGAAAGQTLKA
jgi:hypothetical protein